MLITDPPLGGNDWSIGNGHPEEVHQTVQDTVWHSDATAVRTLAHSENYQIKQSLSSDHHGTDDLCRQFPMCNSALVSSSGMSLDISEPAS